MGPPPAQPGEFHVEIEIPGEVANWSVLEAPAADSIAEDPDGAGVSITGTIIQIEEEDGVVTLRLGTGVVMIEAPGIAREGAPGNAVTLYVPAIQLYPYEL